jgi:hypothetical protein
MKPIIRFLSAAEVENTWKKISTTKYAFILWGLVNHDNTSLIWVCSGTVVSV